MLVDDDRAVLIDVRTETEWNRIGVADIAKLANAARFVPWVDETGTPNHYFADAATEGLSPDTPILLLCRSGVRSNAAADLLAASGYTGAHNIIAGFEGPAGADGVHRGGWKDHLPATSYMP
jgi:rhodanese-related sulfurtransferase